MLAQHFILGQQQSLDGTHQRATLTGEVAGCLALEGGLKQVAGSDADAEGDGLLLGLAAGILIDGIRAVQAAALAEHGAQAGAAALRGNENHVDILRWDDARAVAPVDGEAVTVVEGLARCEVLLDGGPHLYLSGIAEQHAEDGATLGGLFDAEERLARHPAVGHSLFEGLALALAHDDVEAVVAQVASLAGALDAVADDGDDLVFQYFACFLK